jgi:uncharacterized membrane protein
MSAVWTVVAAVGAATIAIKATGPVALGGRALPRRLGNVVDLVAPAVLAALVVTQTWGDGARAFGVGVGAVAVLLRAPLLLVIVVAALGSAGARALG